MDTTSQTTRRPSRSLRVAGTVSAAAAVALVGAVASPSPALARDLQDHAGRPPHVLVATGTDPAALPGWGSSGSAATYRFGTAGRVLPVSAG